MADPFASDDSSDEEEAPKEGKPVEKKRQKVPLGPGCSMMDWVRLANSGKDIAGTGFPPNSLSLFKLPED
jgi:hypothetical protein